jgi:hypothetical protein
MAVFVTGVSVYTTTGDGVSTPVGAGDSVLVMAVVVAGVLVGETTDDGISVLGEAPGDGPVTADVAAGVSVNPSTGDGVSVSAEVAGGVPASACRVNEASVADDVSSATEVSITGDASPIIEGSLTEGSDDVVTAGLIVCAGVPAPVPTGDGGDALVGAALGDGLAVMVVTAIGVPVRDAGISSKLKTPITHASTAMSRRRSAIHRPIGTTVSPLE